MLSKIRIENFKGFDHLEVELDNCTSIVGENGSGKTSLLEALNLVMSQPLYSSRIKEEYFNSENNETFQIEVFFESPITVELPDGYTTQNITCKSLVLDVSRRQRGAPGKALSEPYTIKHYFVPTENIETTDSGWEISRKSGTPFKFTIRTLSVFNAEANDMPKLFYFDKSRERQAKLGYNSSFERLMQEYNWRFRKNFDDIKDELKEKWSEFYSLVFDNVNQKKLRDTFKPISEKVESFLGEEFGKLGLSLINLENPFSKAFISQRKDLKQLPYDILGSGVSMIISFFLLETLSSLYGEEFLIVIDEPEMHLHPQIQYKMIEYLRDASFQTIYSTHSDIMIDMGDWSSIKRLDLEFNCHPTREKLECILPYKGKDITIKYHLNEIKKYHHDKTIFYRENNELLFARKVLLVEGASEKYGLKFLMKKENKDWSNLTIISCNGKSKILNYQLLCKTFSIPYFTIFDLDGDTEEDDKNKEIISWSYEDNYFCFPNSFEAEFNTECARHKGSETLRTIENTDSIPENVNECLNCIDNFN